MGTFRYLGDRVCRAWKARSLALLHTRQRALPAIVVTLVLAALTLAVTYPVIAELGSSLAQNVN